MIYQNAYKLLLTASQQIVSHKQVFARALIDAAVKDYVGISLTNEELLGHLFGEALSHRIHRKLLESRNIYVQEFDVPQTELFYSMAEAVPFVAASHNIANLFAAPAVEGAETVRILDIGVGRGRQLRGLISLISERNPSLKKVSVVALDPVEQNLIDSREMARGLNAEVNAEIEFHPVCEMIEEISDADFQNLGGSTEGPLLVNSAFTLHHTAHPLSDNTTRTQLIERIAQLEPAAFTLIEPSSNHDTEYLPKRFQSAWEHYGTVFALVDESSIDDSHKHLIKQKFFGREIQDIFGTSDYFRSERHEHFESWLLRLHRAGFKPIAAPEIPVSLPEYCRLKVSDGLVRMDYRDLTVVAVFAVHV